MLTDKQRIAILEYQLNQLSRLVLMLVEDRYSGLAPADEWVIIEPDLVEELEKGHNGVIS